MHSRIKALLDKYFPEEEVASGKLSMLAAELDLVLHEQEKEIALLGKSIDLASDAFAERDAEVSSHLELFESAFGSSAEAMLIVDFERENLTFNKACGHLMHFPESYHGEMSMAEFLKRLSESLDNPDNFLTFLRNSHTNTNAFEGEVLLKGGRWLSYHVSPRMRHNKMVGRLWMLSDVTEKKKSERLIEEYRQELNNAHELAKMGAWSYDFDNEMFNFSKGLLELLGLSPEHSNFSLDTLLSLLEENEAQEIHNQILRCEQLGSTIQFELHPTYEGKDYHLIMRGRLKVSNGEDKDHILGVIQDISDLRTKEHLVKVSTHFFQSSMQGNVLMDRKRGILDFNEVACNIFKLKPSEFSERISERLSTAWTHEMSINDIWRHAVENNHWAGEVYFTCPELIEKTIWLSLETLKDKTGKITNFIAIFNDITESKQVQEQLHHMAYFDAQTALPNRFQFEQFLTQKLKSPNLKNAPLTLLYLDLDRFKFVNDSLGHHAGDRLLYLVGQRIVKMIPDATIVARQGGDEFVVLVTGAYSTAQQGVLAEQLIAALAQPFDVFDNQVYIGASLGVVSLPEHADDMVTAMRYADISLYQAKKAGKGCYVFWQTSFLQDTTPERVQLESELRDAIQNNELIMHYQPKVRAETGEVYGLEALVRWQHPRLGLVYPDHFIGIAEESNLIIDLDRWVVKAVAKQLSTWYASGLPLLEVSVNVSGAHITRQDLVELFASLVSNAPYLAEQLEVELTETAIMADPDKATVALNALRALGVKASVDDFGSGYTSLGYLKKLNANTLKIDRSFINGITSEAYDRDVAKAIIALAASMSMDVVAEGVETQEQWHLLQSFGCKYLQGYYFSKPMDALDIEAAYLRKVVETESA